MKVRTAAISLITSLALTRLDATTQIEQGGAGTIDPATVNAQEFVRLTQGSGSDNVYARIIAADSKGNRYIGSNIQPSDAFGNPTNPRSILTKVSPAGQVIWQRERKVRTDENGQNYYERFSEDQPEVPIQSLDGRSGVLVRAIEIDPSDNVVVGFDEVDFSFNSERPLVVKFNEDGKYLWRYLSPDPKGYKEGYYGRSQFKSLDASAADGSILALVYNFAPATQYSYGADQSVIFKLTADGREVFAQHYGTDEAEQVLFNCTPIAFVRSGLNRLFLVTSESPDRKTLPKFDTYKNVVRELDGNGNVLGFTQVPVYPGYTEANPNVPVDRWVAAQADASGNLYVAGTHFRSRPGFNDPDQGEANQLLLKFDPALDQAWRALGPRPKQTYRDQPQVSVVDLRLSSGGITVGGYTTSDDPLASSRDGRWEVTRYAHEDGSVIWHRLYQAPQTGGSGYADLLNGLEVDAAGNVYAGGFVSMPEGTVRNSLIKWADNGDFQFIKHFPTQYNGIQGSTIEYFESLDRAAFVGEVGAKQIAILEFDNPATVLAPPTLLGNISTRARVGTGDNVLIGGFIVVGPEGSSKKVLLRAIGPSLAQAGVAGALADTTLTLNDSQGRVLTNDDWKKSQVPGVSDAEQQAAIEATTVPPSNNAESALVATLPPGPCTAVIGGKGASGVALVEVYDLEQGASASLANISTRGKVETGDNVMIGGVIILGQNPRRVVVRAIGPSLTAAGVAGALQDPTLELVDANGSRAGANDNWHTIDGTATTQEAEIRGTGVAPTDPRESAVQTTLLPGTYTAVVRGKGGTTGVALVEVYRLQ